MCTVDLSVDYGRGAHPPFGANSFGWEIPEGEGGRAARQREKERVHPHRRLRLLRPRWSRRLPASDERWRRGTMSVESVTGNPASA
eukprot:8003238-Alexandrium_andersonii.AAC.1